MGAAVRVQYARVQCACAVLLGVQPRVGSVVGGHHLGEKGDEGRGPVQGVPCGPAPLPRRCDQLVRARTPPRRIDAAADVAGPRETVGEGAVDGLQPYDWHEGLAVGSAGLTKQVGAWRTAMASARRAVLRAGAAGQCAAGSVESRGSRSVRGGQCCWSAAGRGRVRVQKRCQASADA